MAEGPEILEIVPSVLHFPPPLNRIITNILVLKNLSNGLLAYKIRTTAPKRYAVRPNSGFIDANQSVELQVMLHPQATFDPDSVRDKFQVQAVPVDTADAAHLATAFQERSTEVVDARLLVSFSEPQPGSEGRMRLRSKLGGSSMSILGTSVMSSAPTDTTQAPTAPAPQPPQPTVTALQPQPQPQPPQPQPVPVAPVPAPVAPMPPVASAVPALSAAASTALPPATVRYAQAVAAPAPTPAAPAMDDRTAQIAELEARLAQYARKLQEIEAASTAPDGLRQRRPVDSTAVASSPPVAASPTAAGGTGVVVAGINLTMLHVVLLCVVLFLLGRLSTRLV